MSLWDDYKAEIQWAKDRPLNGIWVTRDGKEILICEMTDIHIANVVAMLKVCGDSNDYLPMFEKEKQRRNTVKRGDE